jgi:hypothetical protein
MFKAFMEGFNKGFNDNWNDPKEVQKRKEQKEELAASWKELKSTCNELKKAMNK